jgi:hypothetical protein
MPTFQNMLLFTSSYTQYIVCVSLNSWMSQSITIAISYSLMHPKLLVRLKMGLRMLNNGIVWEFEARSQLLALEGVEGHAGLRD